MKMKEEETIPALGGDEDIPAGEFEVETILSSRTTRRKGVLREEYLIKWKDYDDSYNTWEPRENLINTAAQALETFERLRASGSSMVIKDEIKKEEYFDLTTLNTRSSISKRQFSREVIGRALGGNRVMAIPESSEDSYLAGNIYFCLVPDWNKIPLERGDEATILTYLKLSLAGIIIDLAEEPKALFVRRTKHPAAWDYCGHYRNKPKTGKRLVVDDYLQYPSIVRRMARDLPKHFKEEGIIFEELVTPENLQEVFNKFGLGYEVVAEFSHYDDNFQQWLIEEEQIQQIENLHEPDEKKDGKEKPTKSKKDGRKKVQKRTRSKDTVSHSEKNSKAKKKARSKKQVQYESD
eukprot:TRINITY_DN9935_c0_g1_i1.p1 TRINITY_DN9935_c0_g1~~TRINITY_DN9935_c0_g1_i1.p1  ORF type:complete len:351 (+),score=49.42 TRINITY_DN9935_c0_g1_i1:43-1095(+)